MASEPVKGQAVSSDISIASAVMEMVRGDASVNDVPLARRAHVFAEVFLDGDVMRVAELALRE